MTGEVTVAAGSGSIDLILIKIIFMFSCTHRLFVQIHWALSEMFSFALSRSIYLKAYRCAYI
jgi:hypothetical protein